MVCCGFVVFGVYSQDFCDIWNIFVGVMIDVIVLLIFFGVVVKDLGFRMLVVYCYCLVFIDNFYVIF